jgi:hypothetical protein
MTSYYVSYDKRSTNSDTENQEYKYQVELSSLQMQLTRTVDLVEPVSGGYYTLCGSVSRINGPDGKPSSAYQMTSSPANAIYYPHGYNTPVTSPFWQVSYWIFDVSAYHYILKTDGTPPINISHNNSMLVVTDGTNFCNFNLTGSGVWSNILIEHDPTGTITAWQDGTALTVASGGPISGSVIFGNSNVTLMHGGATVADLRIKDGTADSTTWGYYLNDINTNNGNNVLPPG